MVASGSNPACPTDVEWWGIFLAGFQWQMQSCGQASLSVWAGCD